MAHFSVPVLFDGDVRETAIVYSEVVPGRYRPGAASRIGEFFCKGRVLSTPGHHTGRGRAGRGQFQVFF
jgi:hypothetical protein